jgi:acetate kinase
VKIFVVNTGSTSIKLDVLETEDGTRHPVHSARHQTNGHDVETLLKQFFCDAGHIDAAVHRVVHGGSDLVESRVIDEETERMIEALAALAPLHNPLALRWIRDCRRLLDVPQIAVFDTAFFAAMPVVAKSYAIPPAVAAQFGIHRYGFHGIAHRAMWLRWCELRPDLPDGGRLITVQLGGGCSITATRHGLPQDTSMGFSPAEGLVMATRCGDIDPGAIVHLLRNKSISPGLIEHLINEKSGLTGLSGRSADIRDLIAEPDARARLAVEMYCYRLRKYIGAYQVVLGGADGIVFGGGVGEHMPQVRERTLRDMQWCGIKIDADANRRGSGGEARISTNDSRVDVRVSTVDEAAILAGEACRVLKSEEEKHHD